MNMINKSFNNLPERGIYSFIATFPSFIPIQSSKATAKEQENANHYIKNIYETLYMDPTIMGFKTIPDDALSDWEMQKNKPGLVPKLRGIISKIEGLVSIIFHIALYGNGDGDTTTIEKSDIKLKPSNLKLLSVFGIESTTSDSHYTFTFPEDTRKGLSLLAKISKDSMKGDQKKPYLLFSRGVFDTKAPYTQEVFGNMLNDRSAFDRLIHFLDENLYERIDNKLYGDSISLDYIKNYGDPNEVLKGSWAERTHSGIEVLYEDSRMNQPIFALRIPYFNQLLNNSEKMNSRVKSFVINTSKKCDNCRYCVQTDKTGKRPLIFINIDDYEICPLFCGFNYRWKNIDDTLVDHMIDLLKYIDDVLVNSN